MLNCWKSVTWNRSLNQNMLSGRRMYPPIADTSPAAMASDAASMCARPGGRSGSSCGSGWHQVNRNCRVATETAVSFCLLLFGSAMRSHSLRWPTGTWCRSCLQERLWWRALSNLLPTLMAVCAGAVWKTRSSVKKAAMVGHWSKAIL